VNASQGRRTEWGVGAPQNINPGWVVWFYANDCLKRNPSSGTQAVLKLAVSSIVEPVSNRRSGRKRGLVPRPDPHRRERLCLDRGAEQEALPTASLVRRGGRWVVAVAVAVRGGREVFPGEVR
jgi:hypothetical protein